MYLNPQELFRIASACAKTLGAVGRNPDTICMIVDTSIIHAPCDAQIAISPASVVQRSVGASQLDRLPTDRPGAPGLSLSSAFCISPRAERTLPMLFSIAASPSRSPTGDQLEVPNCRLPTSFAVPCAVGSPLTPIGHDARGGRQLDRYCLGNCFLRLDGTV